MQENVVDPYSEQRARLRRRGICVVIPTYNNVGTIGDVVMRAKAQCDDVIVVNDGSSDGTDAVLSAVDGVTVVDIPHNSGKGNALKQGFLKARTLGFSYAITLDGDGQHYPEDIRLLLEANIKNPTALIVGQRKGLAQVERSAGSKFANAFSNFWFCIQTLNPLSDTQTGYRMYPLHKLYGLRFLTSRYEAELELLVFAAWHGVRLVATEVNVYYPPREQRVSHFRPLQDFTRISILNTVLCFLAVVYGYPLMCFKTLATALRTIYTLLFFLFFTLMAMTPMAYLVLLLGKAGERTVCRLHSILHFMSNFVMNVHGIPGVRYKMNNRSGEDFHVPAVIICNHQSPLDLMPLLALHKKIVVVTNDRIWRNPFYGYIIRHAGFLPASEGSEQMVAKLRPLVAQGYSVAIYPEGTRCPEGKIGRFHKGAFYIARNLNLDIIPLILHGAGRVLPKGGFCMRKGEIRLDIDARMSVEEQAQFSTDRALASWYRKYYERRYSEISDESVSLCCDS